MSGIKMKNNFPKISIVTPNFNGGEFLEQTILSVIGQNYPNLEYIIIDGGSSDNSINIIKKYEKYLTYWISEPDNGMYEAIQKGFEKSTGEIMAWINSDDMYHKNALFTISDIFQNLELVEWITGINTNYDEQGRTFNARLSYTHNRYSQFLEPQKHIQQESTFWRRSLWEKIGSNIDSSLKYAGDFDLWIRFNRHSQVYITDALIGGFRIRKNQLTQLFMNEYNNECQKTLEREINLFNFYDNSVLKEIQDLKNKLTFTSLDESEKITLRKQIKQLSKENEKIIFNIQKQQFELKEINMSNITSIIAKRRNNMADFLSMIKDNIKYYPEIILDVGVANGTPELYEIFPQSKFILFEALEEFVPKMEEYKNKYKDMHIEICALGSEENEIEINVHPDLVGSSIYIENEDSNVNGVKRKVPLRTLNSFQNKYNFIDKSILLKIDVQGAELDVIRGADKILSYIDVIILEVSLFDFFDNNIQFIDILKYMDEIGFVPYDIFGFSNRPYDSALAQVDIAFVKKDSIFREKHIFATPEQRIQLNDELTRNSKQGYQVSNVLNFDFSKQFNVLYSQISELKKQNEKYLIYGAGTISNFIYSILEAQIIAKVDQNSSLMSDNIKRDEVYNPENIKTIKFDKIIISVLGREKEILKYLNEEFSIPLDKILTFKIEV
jgi:FkbM family methyltransferase